MSEMVRRIARLMSGNVLFDEISTADDLDWEKLARVAIRGMREPTKKMLLEGNRVTTDGRGAEDSWPAMIDQALK
jgi:hypothetical protein